MSEEALEFLGQSGFIRIEDKAQLLDVYFLLKVSGLQEVLSKQRTILLNN